MEAWRSWGRIHRGSAWRCKATGDRGASGTGGTHGAGGSWLSGQVIKPAPGVRAIASRRGIRMWGKMVRRAIIVRRAISNIATSSIRRDVIFSRCRRSWGGGAARGPTTGQALIIGGVVSALRIRRTRSILDCTPNLMSSFRHCLETVWTEVPNSAAISFMPSPRTILARMSCSRWVRGIISLQVVRLAKNILGPRNRRRSTGTAPI